MYIKVDFVNYLLVLEKYVGVGMMVVVLCEVMI